MNKNKGFTLIELLVVIAIIGILSSVVLASLNTARNKGADAAIKSNINNARAQAELFYSYNDTNTYTGVCAALASATRGGIATMVTGATNAGGTVVCTDAAAAWAMSSSLKSDTTHWYCVDSTGQAKLETAVVGPVTVCP